MKKTALITGGAIRIGRALAETCARRDYQLMIHYHASDKEARQFSSQLSQMNVVHHLLQCDLSDRAQLETLFQRIPPAFKPIDLLINSAAIFPDQDCWDDVGINWDGIMTINSLAPILLSQQFSQQAIEKERDFQIINILDARLSRAQSDRPVYRWSKQLLKQATKDLAVTLAPHVRVNGIALGAILPPPGKAQDHLDRLAKDIPLKRTGDLGNIGHALDYLLNQRFVTGDILTLDGGEFL